MFSIKRVGLTLSAVGALIVGGYSAAMLMGSCEANVACSASVYFGVPSTQFNAPNISMSTRDTTVMSVSEGGFSIATFHNVIQITGLYLLLLGVSMVIALELKELKLLSKKSRRKGAH
jgi:hypothetical protein